MWEIKDSSAGAENQWFSKGFSFKNGNILTPPKSKTSRIPEPELDINCFQKGFLKKNNNILTPSEI